MRFRLNISPRTQRRLGRYWSRVSWYIGYPFYHIRNFFAAIGMMLAEWWRRRNIRHLLQGLPALLMTIGILAVGALVYAQDRPLNFADTELQIAFGPSFVPVIAFQHLLGAISVVLTYGIGRLAWGRDDVVRSRWIGALAGNGRWSGSAS